ncbi:Appressoria-specific virulence factor GAS1 [Cladobotryum mycophilum]|uniref:Appressoria-specific virulence factor GAS1 n=1 Tax=Cladobotryum mycophilum TaxID=491253 RepID=A0ABR0SGZ7_9HYPO
MPSFKAALASCVFLSTQLVSCHCVFIAANGDAGGKGMALGVDPTTPRTCTSIDPCQRDTTVFSGRTIANMGIGQTSENGVNNVEKGTARILKLTGGVLPLVTSGGYLSMVVHQINGDGAGPFGCEINADGAAKTWSKLQLTVNIPGENGVNSAALVQWPLKATIPKGQTCTGTAAGKKNICLVRCHNPAPNGPFGGVMPVQLVAKAPAIKAAR